MDKLVLVCGRLLAKQVAFARGVVLIVLKNINGQSFYNSISYVYMYTRLFRNVSGYLFRCSSIC